MKYSYFVYLHDKSLTRSKRFVNLATSNQKEAKERMVDVLVRLSNKQLAFLYRKEDSGMFSDSQYLINKDWISSSIFNDLLRREGVL